MTAFISRAYGSKEWEVIIKTDCKEHYEQAELFARMLIDHGKTHPMTNADRYRAMSDEELADEFMRFFEEVMNTNTDGDWSFADDFRDELLKDLRQPVKEDKQ